MSKVADARALSKTPGADSIFRVFTPKQLGSLKHQPWIHVCMHVHMPLQLQSCLPYALAQMMQITVLPHDTAGNHTCM